MLWNAVRSAFYVVLTWIHTFYNSIFLTSGALNGLRNLIFIGTAVLLFVLILKFIRNTTWGG